MLRVLGLFLLFLAIAAGAVGLIVVGIRHGVEVGQRKQWLSTNGTVLISRVTDSSNRGQHIHVDYRYEIAGETYEGSGNVSDPGTRRIIPPALQPGQPITVLYDAEAPTSSALEPGDHGPTIFFIIFGSLGLLLVSLPLAYFSVMLFVHIMMIKVRYHQRKAMGALTEAIAESNRICNEEGRMPPELTQRGSEAIEQAAEVHAVVKELEEQLAGETHESNSNATEMVQKVDVPVANPLPMLGYGWFWRIVLFAVAIYAVAWVVVLAWLPKLSVYLMFGAGIVGFAATVGSGIWLGQRMVERGRRRQANLIGWCLIVFGAGTFGWFASRSKEGYWETVANGHIIGPAGTLLGLGVLFCGLGMAMRHSRKNTDD